jgi:DNA polymerase
MSSSSLAEAARIFESLYADLLDLPFFPPDGSESAAAKVSSARSLNELAEEVRFCQACVLHIGRKQSVFGRGDPSARVVFIGDFPSETDNGVGSPFTDEAGMLLNKMVTAMKIKPEDAYFTNIFKCHPPVGQQVSNDLFPICERHLSQQLESLSAKVIVALGELASRALARSEAPLRVLRTQEFGWNDRSVFCTHHPRELLHSTPLKKEAWEDLQRVMKVLASK